MVRTKLTAKRTRRLPDWLIRQVPQKKKMRKDLTKQRQCCQNKNKSTLKKTVTS